MTDLDGHKYENTDNMSKTHSQTPILKFEISSLRTVLYTFLEGLQDMVIEDWVYQEHNSRITLLYTDRSLRQIDIGENYLHAEGCFLIWYNVLPTIPATDIYEYPYTHLNVRGKELLRFFGPDDYKGNKAIIIHANDSENFTRDTKVFILDLLKGTTVEVDCITKFLLNLPQISKLHIAIEGDHEFKSGTTESNINANVNGGMIMCELRNKKSTNKCRIAMVYNYACEKKKKY